MCVCTAVLCVCIGMVCACIHCSAVCVHGCGVCTGRETQGSSMNPGSGGEGGWRKVALTWMAMFLPSTPGRATLGAVTYVCIRGMSVSPGQVRAGSLGAGAGASASMMKASACLRPFGASLPPPLTAMAPSSPCVGPTCPPRPAFCCLILLVPGRLLAFGHPATEIQRREVN